MEPEAGRSDIGSQVEDGATVLDVLTLEEIDRDLYRSTLPFPDPLPLYGGQVAAQALLAAGGTVDRERCRTPCTGTSCAAVTLLVRPCTG